MGVDREKMEHCLVTGKLKFGSYNETMTFVNGIDRHGVKAYRCRNCDSWHFTTKMETFNHFLDPKGRRIRRRKMYLDNHH